MNSTALELVARERICVLAVPLADGTPHAAVLHYSHTTDPLRFYMQTYPTTKTATIQSAGGTCQASLVIGLSEAALVELQMRGVVRIVTDQTELDRIYSTHYLKLPESEKYKDSETIFLEFSPTWWRYTDFNTDPETIIES